MCGVAGVFGVPNPGTTVQILVNDCLSNRGEGGAGIVLSGYNDNLLWERSERGALDLMRRLSRYNFSDNKGDYYCGLGHVRYGTSGERRSFNDTQPLMAEMSWGRVFISHNGDSLFAQEDRQELVNEGIAFSTSSDTELILHYICLSGVDNPVEAIRKGLKRYRGTYALVMLVRDREETQLIAARDPSGNRPLSLGRLGSGYVVASENSTFEMIKASYERDISPNELLVISKRGLNSQLIDDNTALPLCMCEYELGYFSRPHSKVFGIPVYAFREELGRRLASRFGHEIHPSDVISYIPESANFYAQGFAKSINRDLTVLLIRLHSTRSFIQENPQVIESTLRRKFGFLRDKAEEILRRNPDTRLWLIDDSVVRGTTARRITRVFKTLGFKWIGWLFGEPPILGPCSKGIDMLSQGGSLIAPRYLKSGIMPDCAGIAREIESEFVGYLPLVDLYDAVSYFGRRVNISRKDFCFGCFENREPIWGKW